ncbi:hypothetical protein B0H10DRAFT_1953033 [Mycena sp. CBHHK59/15]|nr:hypothetical protein B0H10DRAFT_1953033 [Mycena sp. CBHHK59/15]
MAVAAAATTTGVMAMVSICVAATDKGGERMGQDSPATSRRQSCNRPLPFASPPKEQFAAVSTRSLGHAAVVAEQTSEGGATGDNSSDGGDGINENSVRYDEKQQDTTQYDSSSRWGSTGPRVTDIVQNTGGCTTKHPTTMGYLAPKNLKSDKGDHVGHVSPV